MFWVQARRAIKFLNKICFARGMTNNQINANYISDIATYMKQLDAINKDGKNPVMLRDIGSKISSLESKIGGHILAVDASSNGANNSIALYVGNITSPSKVALQFRSKELRGNLLESIKYLHEHCPSANPNHPLFSKYCHGRAVLNHW
jgi:hypothetical protein